MGYWYTSEKPIALPVDTVDAAAHLRLDSVENDTALIGYILAATEQAEALIGPVVSQTVTQIEDRWPSADRICFRVPRVTELIDVTYRLYTGNTQTLDPALYAVDLAGCCQCVHLVPGASWPSVELWPSSPILLQYKAGWPVGAVPDRVRHAILLLTGLYYETREAATYSMTGGNYAEVPWAVLQLLADYRWGWR